MNRVVGLLANQKFDVRILPSLDEQFMYVCLDLHPQILLQEAENVGLKMKRSDVDLKMAFRKEF